jgi:hypothetical protein
VVARSWGLHRQRYDGPLPRRMCAGPYRARNMAATRWRLPGWVGHCTCGYCAIVTKTPASISRMRGDGQTAAPPLITMSCRPIAIGKSSANLLRTKQSDRSPNSKIDNAFALSRQPQHELIGDADKRPHCCIRQRLGDRLSSPRCALHRAYPLATRLTPECPRMYACGLCPISLRNA